MTDMKAVRYEQEIPDVPGDCVIASTAAMIDPCNHIQISRD